MRDRVMIADRRQHGRAGFGVASGAVTVAMMALLAVLVAGCTMGGNQQSSQVEQTLDVGGAVNPNLEAVTPGATPETAPTQAFAPNAARVHFAPIVGAPVDKVTALSRRLAAAGPANNVRIEPSQSAAVNHEIRGYFSALSENGATTVIHVWDVFSPNGQRVHRIQGQARVAGASGDPWASVPPSTMEQIADTVLSEYLTWRGQSA